MCLKRYIRSVRSKRILVHQNQSYSRGVKVTSKFNAVSEKMATRKDGYFLVHKPKIQHPTSGNIRKKSKTSEAGMAALRRFPRLSAVVLRAGDAWRQPPNPGSDLDVEVAAVQQLGSDSFYELLTTN